MKIEISGSPKEIAALVLAVQERQKEKEFNFGLAVSDGCSNNLIAENGQNGEADTAGSSFKASIL